MTLKIVILAGDGVGPECVAEGKKILDLFNSPSQIFTFVSCLIGGCAIDKHGLPLPPSTLAECRTADAILLGAVGGPQWTTIRPEQGLLEIRKELGLFCNLRPCFFPGKSLLQYSPLKAEIVENVSFTVVRELTGGIYFGRRVEGDVATDEMKYTRAEVERITRVAGQLAMQSSPPLHITSVDKANVLATSRLWRKVVTEVLTIEFPLLKFCHALVDSTAMVMVKNPKKLNGIILTENMFGDILSDEASVIPGSLGLLGSASISGLDGNKGGIYEPIHGSAPDIAGICNPIGTILSVSMMLELSLGMPKEAQMVRRAVEEVLDVQGLRTFDLGGCATTSEIGDAVVEVLKKYLISK